MDNFRLPPRRDDSNQRNNSRAAGRYTYRLVVSFCTFAVATPETQSRVTVSQPNFMLVPVSFQDLAWETGLTGHRDARASLILVESEA